MLISILNDNEHIYIELSPFFVAIFVFCFSITIGSIWEIYEYVTDGILKTNMQKFITSDGIVLEGHKALTDTMKDIVVDSIGAFISSIISYIFTKKRVSK